jgi:predicted O-linked N-acetylglucosamine transferase (SPINDLY family)
MPVDGVRHAGDIAVASSACMARQALPDQLFAEAVQLHRAGRLTDAIRLYAKIIRKAPRNASALHLHGLACFQAGRLEDAAASIRDAIAFAPALPDVHYNMGTVLQALGRQEEAIASYHRALAAKPDDAEAHNNLGTALRAQNRYAEAIKHYRRAVALKQDFADAEFNLANALEAVPDDEAIAHYERAIALRPNFAGAYGNFGKALMRTGRYERAAASFRKLLELEPAHREAFSWLAEATLATCDWANFDQTKQAIEESVASNQAFISPFVLIKYCDDPALQLKCARDYLKGVLKPAHADATPVAREQGRIRLAYLSADFYDTSSAQLFTRLFELHDRSRFEVIGVSYGPDDGSEIRSRIVKAFDRFVDIRFKSDREAAALLRDLEIDVAVDLQGYTRGTRLALFALRIAPVQVTYLGFQGTTGADFIDYIIGDRIALPVEMQMHFSEKIVHLPDCHQVTDTAMPIAPDGPTRSEAGLPGDAFVFCCFNNNDKINPPMFDVWMRILSQVEGSVLWLIADSATSRRNLRREATARGVNPERLVWGEAAPIATHLARHRLADIYLDTQPMGAHTSASRALWAGLPILTCAGESFAGRVAASMLHAIGLEELVACNLAEYEKLAVKLAREPRTLREFRDRLATNRESSPLFDTDRFRRYLESAFTTMLETVRCGETPRSFAVEPPEGR